MEIFIPYRYKHFNFMPTNEEQRNNSMVVLLALALGVAIGVNWPKIKKNLQPVIAGLEKQYSNSSFDFMKFFASQKERFEDMMAERKIKKRPKRPAKKRV
jgi:hypothetical protein